MSPEIGASRQFIERRGGPTYDWDQTTLTIDNAVHALDLSAIVPSNAVWVKFHVVITAGTINKVVQLRNKTATQPDWVAAIYNSGVGGVCNVETFLKLSSSQSCAYLVQTGITNITITVLGWML